MMDLCRLIFWTLIDLMRARATLEAEIWVLRQQLNVLRRSSPKRQSFGTIDRLIFVGLYRLIDRGFTQATAGAILRQGGANALVGVLIFQITDYLPIFVDRRRSMGGGRMRISRRLD